MPCMPPVLSGRAQTRLQAMVLRAVRDEGPLSRVELAARLDVSRTTVAAEVGRLIELGLATDAGPAESRGGRRSTMVDLDDRLRFVGIDVGATSMNVALTDGRLTVLARAQDASVNIREGGGPDGVLARAIELTRKLLDEHEVDRPAGVGIGVPGPVDFHSGVPVSPPIMPGWDRYPVREVLSQELGCPALLDNDVNVMALGEQHTGVARSAEDFLFVKLGTGVGCGIVVDRQLYRGVDGCAGDIGHIRVSDDGPVCACGNTGCLEAYFGGADLSRDATAAASNGSSAALAVLLEQHGRLGGEEVAAALALGDPTSLALVRTGGRHVGAVLANLVSFFNPGLIVIGGGLARLGHPLLAEVRSVVYRQSLPLATGNLPVVLSELGDDAGVVGAARLISDAVFAADQS